MDATPPLPPPAPAAALSPEEASQLRLLSIFHYVLAGFTALFSLFPLIHLAMGIAIITGAMPMDTPADQEAPFDPRLFGWFFVVFAALFIAAGMTLAGYMAYAGRCLAQRRRHLLCMVVAGLSCMFMPFGTVLGVFSLVVLSRPSIKAAFAPAASR